MKIFYFTGTGNSLYIAQRIGGELYSIPQILRCEEQAFSDEDGIGFVFPTYGHSVPKIVTEFLNKVKFESPYIFAVMTYSEHNGDAVKYFSRMAKKRGITVNYANAVSMHGNHIPMADIKSEITKDKGIEAQLEKLISDISYRKEFIKPGKGADPVLRNMIKLIHSIRENDSNNFIVTEACVGCKTCVKVCPRNNITLQNNKPKFESICEECQACVHICPKKAIQINGDKNPTVRYRNKNITMIEIVNSNK